MDLVEKLKASGIPEELRALPQWVCWRVEDRLSKGEMKPTKVPVNAHNGKNAAVDDKSTWATFDQALSSLESIKGLAGVGFVFSADDHFVGVDIDKCRVNGIVDVEAAKWSKRLKSYGEISWSGGGMHVILKGQLPPNGRRKGRWEMYEQGRFFVMTGDRCLWCSEKIEHRQQELDELHTWIFSRGTTKTDQIILGPFVINPNAEPATDYFDALLEADPSFARTWNHDRPEHPEWSASEYDLALASRAAMAQWTDQQIVDLVIAHRRKHGEGIKEHVQYYELTLRKAREGLRAPHARVEQELGVDPAQVDTATLLDQVSTKLGLPEDSRIIGIEEYTGDPPLYRIKTLRGNVDVKNVSGLIEHGQLKRLIAQACKIVIRSFKAQQWDPVAQAILASLTVVEVGQEGHPLNRLADMVEEFIENHPLVTEDWQAAAQMHQPFILNGRVHISLRGVMRFLDAHSTEKLKETDVARGLRQTGWTPTEKAFSFRISGKPISRRTWDRPLEGPDVIASVMASQDHGDDEVNARSRNEL